jgi:hypothetical protein
MMMASELLLQTAEQYAFLVAMSANMTEEEEEGVNVVRLSRQNIGVSLIVKLCILTIHGELFIVHTPFQHMLATKFLFRSTSSNHRQAIQQATIS